MSTTGTIRDVMTPYPVTLVGTSTIIDAAKIMRDSDVGGVIVLTDGEVAGFLTDRDIAVRAVAEGQTDGCVIDICSTGATTVTPDTSLEEARDIMQGEAIRRLPVVENGRAIGIVSLGDLALADDAEAGEALADISAAPANN
jgi:CBS domain-containing protein